MRILIVHASRYGSTQGIANRIAQRLWQEEKQWDVAVRSVEQARDLANYDAFVIGSAVYYFRWLKRASALVRRNHVLLATRPVWLFSSGPLGSQTTDGQGRDLRSLAEPKEIAEFRRLIHPQDHRVFFGALHPGKMSFFHRLVLLLPANRDHALFPEGDFRDWSDIEAWAGRIAESLPALVRDSVVRPPER